MIAALSTHTWSVQQCRLHACTADHLRAAFRVVTAYRLEPPSNTTNRRPPPTARTCELYELCSDYVMESLSYGTLCCSGTNHRHPPTANHHQPPLHANRHQPPTNQSPTANQPPIRIYELYSEYVLKNPFYETEQVIKCELFDEHLEALVRRYPQSY